MWTKYQHRCIRKGRRWNTHCGISLFDVSLPEEESDNKEDGNDQGAEDIGSSPSLDRSRRNGEYEEYNGRCREYELMISADNGGEVTHKRVSRYR